MNSTSPYVATSQLETQPKKRRIRWWLIISIFAVPFAVLFVGTFVLRVGWTIRESQGQKKMQVELQRLAAEGIATDNQAISQRYQSRTSNAFSSEWSSLFAKVTSPEFAASSSGVPVLDRTIEVDDFADDFDTSAQWPYAENCIRFTHEQIASIAEARRLAAETKPTNFPIVFLSNETLLPEVQNVRTVAWLLRTDAQVAMYERDRNRAFEDIVALCELTKHVDAVPFAISRLVGIAVRRLAMQSLQNAIRLDLLDDDQLREVDKLVASYSNIDDQWRTLIVDEMSSNLPVFANPNISLQTNKNIPARGHDAVFFIGLMRSAMEIETKDWLSFYNSSIELEAELDKGIDSSVGRVDRILSGLFAPAFGALSATLINDAQLHRQARVAIALRLYQHQYGNLPAQLNELSESTQELKPAGARPFGYSCDGDRAVLWGFLLSQQTRQTPMQEPDTLQPNTTSLNNRLVVWRFAPQEPFGEPTEN